MSKTGLAALLVIVSFSAACRGSGEGPTKNASGNYASSPASDFDPVLDSLVKALQGVQSYRARITITAAQQDPVEYKIDHAMPDRIHFISDQVEMVMIGAANYSRSRGGAWAKSNAEMPIIFTSLKNISQDLEANNSVRSLGNEDLDGIATHIYQYNATMPPAPGTIESSPVTYIAKLWIGADGLPRKLERQQPNGETKTTIVYYDYNAKITIEAPAS
jgi:hypothetical protein